jgi:hypothetical protein
MKVELTPEQLIKKAIQKLKDKEVNPKIWGVPDIRKKGK